MDMKPRILIPRSDLLFFNLGLGKTANKIVYQHTVYLFCDLHLFLGRKKGQQDCQPAYATFGLGLHREYLTEFKIRAAQLPHIISLIRLTPLHRERHFAQANLSPHLTAPMPRPFTLSYQAQTTCQHESLALGLGFTPGKYHEITFPSSRRKQTLAS